MIMLLVFFCLIHSISTNEIFKYTIQEKSPSNTPIADFSRDFRISSLVSYSLLTLIATNEQFFSLDSRTGRLTTTRTVLDRDQLCFEQQCSCQSCEMTFQLRIDINQTILYKIILIQIEDINDHSPIFDHPPIKHTIHIQENIPLGYRIVLPIATDPDEGLNSVQTYTLSGEHSNDFEVDYSSIDTPCLIVRSALDVSYSLTLTSSDLGRPPRSTSIGLNIRITNTSIPTFVQSVYRIDIREDVSLGTDLLTIEATNDNQAPIFYELLTESPFVIDRITGNIQLRQSLDYERKQSYRLTIKAHDNFQPTYAVVFIRVIDVNDNPVSIRMEAEEKTRMPREQRGRYLEHTTLQQRSNDHDELLISEDTPVGTILAHIILTDRDSIVNGNPYLQITASQSPLPLIYRLIYENPFRNTKFYALILHTKLDRESQSFYNSIQLKACDSGTPALHQTLVLSLNISDVNDCIPQIITNSTIYHINENNPIGLIIDRLNGYDCDAGVNAELEFEILNQTDVLIVHSQTGQLSLNQSIDFEAFNTTKNLTTIDLEFLVRVRDHGQPSLSSDRKITLRIHDLNDHSPTFEANQSYNWTFAKAVLQSNAVLGRIIARDSDSGLQGIVHYSIHSFQPCLSLEITSLGYIYISTESSCPLLSTYVYEITASDYGIPYARSTKQILTINIDDDDTSFIALPQLVPLSTSRIMVDSYSLDTTSFVLDITSNHSLQPRLQSDPSTCVTISSTGEIRLISPAHRSSYIVPLHIFDDYSEEYFSKDLQINICNSSIRHSCRTKTANDDDKENTILMFWAICLAMIITCLSILIVAIITCLCCRKQSKEKRFLQCHDEVQCEKTLQTSSSSTDRDSAYIVHADPVPKTIPIRTNVWPSNQPETYFYDLKRAELMRHSTYPPYVYLNAQLCQSLSTDHGFGSSEMSPSSTPSSSGDFNPSFRRPINKNCFISTYECVV